MKDLRTKPTFHKNGKSKLLKIIQFVIYSNITVEQRFSTWGRRAPQGGTQNVKSTDILYFSMREYGNTKRLRTPAVEHTKNLSKSAVCRYSQQCQILVNNNSSLKAKHYQNSSLNIISVIIKHLNKEQFTIK